MHSAALESEAVFQNSKHNPIQRTPPAQQENDVEIKSGKNALIGIILGALFSIPIWVMIFVLARRIS